jgi:vitellogenic carboxypeptidase-like protein
LYTQGGPGCSSLFGTFYLNGPFALQTDLSLQPNPGRWNRQYGMLFVDQPIGTGFSIAGEAPLQQLCPYLDRHE